MITSTGIPELLDKMIQNGTDPASSGTACLVEAIISNSICAHKVFLVKFELIFANAYCHHLLW